MRIAIFAVFIFLVLRPYMKSITSETSNNDETRIFEASNPDAELKREWDHFIKDYENIKNVDIFMSQPRTENAYGHFKKYLKDEKDGLKIVIPEELREKNKDLKVKINWKEYEDLFHVFDGIAKYNYLREPELNSVDSNKTAAFWETDLIKDYFNISPLVYLRLVKAIEQREFDKGVKEVRQFIKLLMTVDNKVYPILVAGILTKENELRDKFKLDAYKNPTSHRRANLKS